MKYIMFFSIVVSSLSLNAMDAPNVTQWREICKDSEKKEQLKAVYKDFCTQRYNNAVPWTVASWVPLGGWCAAVLKKPSYSQIHPKKMIAFGLLSYLFAYYKMDSLGQYNRRKYWADQGKLYHLNDDVLKELGNPKVKEHQSSFRTVSFVTTNDIQSSIQHSTLHVDNVEGIQKALSGYYRNCPEYGEDGYNPFAATSLMIKTRTRSMQQRITDWIHS